MDAQGSAVFEFLLSFFNPVLPSVGDLVEKVNKSHFGKREP